MKGKIILLILSALMFITSIGVVYADDNIGEDSLSSSQIYAFEQAKKNLPRKLSYEEDEVMYLSKNKLGTEDVSIDYWIYTYNRNQEEEGFKDESVPKIKAFSFWDYLHIDYSKAEHYVWDGSKFILKDKFDSAFHFTFDGYIGLVSGVVPDIPAGKGNMYFFQHPPRVHYTVLIKETIAQMEGVIKTMKIIVVSGIVCLASFVGLRTLFLIFQKLL